MARRRMVLEPIDHKHEAPRKMTGPHRLIQGYTIVALAAATLTAVAVAQSANAPRNDLPQSYRTTRDWGQLPPGVKWAAVTAVEDRKSTRLNSSHTVIS